MATLLGWCHALPADVVQADPRLSLTCGWPLILTEQLDAAEPYVVRAEAGAQERGDQGLLGEVSVAQAHIARTRGDHPRAVVLAERALALLPPDNLSARSVMGVNLGVARWFEGRLVGPKKRWWKRSGRRMARGTTMPGSQRSFF
jgi:ATP/maltotriose-dependent transcriptional regulator MalT